MLKKVVAAQKDQGPMKDPPRDSTLETPVSDASLFTRPIDRDQAKTRDKRKGKEVASQSSSLLSDGFTNELR